MNGQSKGVISFTNTPSHEQEGASHEWVWHGQRLWTGEKWQCVEYVRRYLIQTRGITFPSVRTAYELIELPYMLDLRSGQSVPLRWYDKQCYDQNPPKEGDILLIREGKVGHVGMVHAVSGNDIYVADQNWEYGKYWQTNRFAYILSKPDQLLLGWLHVG